MNRWFACARKFRGQNVIVEVVLDVFGLDPAGQFLSVVVLRGTIAPPELLIALYFPQVRLVLHRLLISRFVHGRLEHLPW